MAGSQPPFAMSRPLPDPLTGILAALLWKRGPKVLKGLLYRPLEFHSLAAVGGSTESWRHFRSPEMTLLTVLTVLPKIEE